MDLRIITVGKPSRETHRVFVDKYVKRLRSVWPTEIVSVAAEKLTQNSNDGDVMRREAERIVAKCPVDWPIVALDRRGASIGSEDFSQRMVDWQDSGMRGVTFVIGGALGLASEFVERAAHRLSFGPMTLPHDLALIVLTEQIYRAMTIAQGHPYHR